MYAIIQTGGKQYRVEKGETIEIELVGIESGAVEFNEVLLLNDGKTTHIGTPHVAKCLVKGEVLGSKKCPKVISFKYKRRKNYHRKVGHRQKHSVVKITDIVRS
ncbi:MAG: 50S ribosomal protein L21 [Chlamydiae bacterium]|nr:50S ribosomal protein L21 [Chlamydiota bacterium]